MGNLANVCANSRTLLLVPGGMPIITSIYFCLLTAAAADCGTFRNSPIGQYRFLLVSTVLLDTSTYVGAIAAGMSDVMFMCIQISNCQVMPPLRSAPFPRLYVKERINRKKRFWFLCHDDGSIVSQNQASRGQKKSLVWNGNRKNWSRGWKGAEEWDNSQHTAHIYLVSPLTAYITRSRKRQFPTGRHTRIPNANSLLLQYYSYKKKKKKSRISPIDPS